MAKLKSPKPFGQYDVGYGRPPMHSRFKPGESGNRAGRRKGQPTPNEIFMKEAARLVKIKRGDTVETITKHEAIIRRLLQAAMEGDMAAARLALGLAQSEPSANDAPAEDETANLALSATPDEETVRRMLARFGHLQAKEEEADFMSEVDEARTKGEPHAAVAGGEARVPVNADMRQFEALATFARVDFWCFVELMFPILYPGQKLVYAGYLELIATLLMRVGQGRYRNVIINLPPRHMKSALASILYPAWRLGCDPTVKFICISYGDDLAHDLSAQTRKIMRSPLYKVIFPGTTLDKSAVDHIRTTLGGYRYATAVGSDITGFGADEIIVDDPVQPEDALSERVKQQLRDWVNSSVYTRFNDPSRGALVLVMHRLAPDDLAGTIEASADFVLKLPLIAEITENYTYQDRTIMRREPGEPLNPRRVSVAEIEALKARIAPNVFASQYQQRPEAGGTGYCSIERLTRYAEAPPFELIVHSWDIASRKGGGDWTVCAKFGLAKESDGRDILYLTSIVRMQVELPDVREAIIAHDSLEKPAIIVMDGNGIGRGPYQDLWARGFRHLLPGESMASSASDNLKIRRFSEGQFSLYDGFVRLPNAMPGLEALLAEIAAFPGGKHDDQVDALSYVAAYREKVIYEARRWGLKLGRLRPPPAKVYIVPAKSRDQELYDRRRSRQD